jgi:hypothetical protein
MGSGVADDEAAIDAHPNAAGHRLLASALAAGLDQ